MPCFTNTNVTVAQKAKMLTALEQLQKSIGRGTVTIVVSKLNGAVAFNGWRAEDREGLSDICAYRALMSSPNMAPELRNALRKAQIMAGTPVSTRAIASGLHSHDGGSTWSRH